MCSAAAPAADGERMLQDALAADAKTGARKSASAKDPFADLGVKFVEVRALALPIKLELEYCMEHPVTEDGDRPGLLRPAMPLCPSSWPAMVGKTLLQNIATEDSLKSCFIHQERKNTDTRPPSCGHPQTDAPSTPSRKDPWHALYAQQCPE